MKGLFRKKPIQDIQALESDTEHHLKRTLSAFDLTCLGIGGVIGVGIFVITGVAAAKSAGPAIILSFSIAMLACIFSAFCYAEFASLLPVAGSAYNYSYATFGELLAWIIGWDLILEYVVGSILVAIGWSGYFIEILKTLGITLPAWCAATPGTIPGAIINLPAAVIVLFLTILLTIGIKESARFITAMVFVKLAAVLTFIVVGFSKVDPANWRPFMPFGFSGMMTGAAMVFLAYVGFDAVSTAAEEAKNPKRDLPIGIIASLIICTILYIAVSAILTGMIPYQELNTSAPIAYALSKHGFNWGSALVSAGAVTGLTSVLIVLMMGQPRIFFAMSRDGLLWPWASKVHPRFKTPYRTQILTGLVVASFAAFSDIGVVAELVNIGTLFAFTLVCGGILVLRHTHPNLPRSFKTPFVPIVPLLGMGFCIYLMMSLPQTTWIRFGVWLVLGLVIYFSYGRRHSLLASSSSR
ncbi:MAG: amino acid permease [Deltaproteobacteria bacterium RIFCSPLOWO2_01_44_7]|nr:MAG: amino acid permease [Deltaproteobacteria bacterium RIFCSPLOWO2_01_44_7]